MLVLTPICLCQHLSLTRDFCVNVKTQPLSGARLPSGHNTLDVLHPDHAPLTHHRRAKPKRTSLCTISALGRARVVVSRGCRRGMVVEPSQNN
eukprot:583506-Prymnesium_polylepis.1